MVTFQIHGLNWVVWDNSKATYVLLEYNWGFCEGFPNSLFISAYISCALRWSRGGGQKKATLSTLLWPCCRELGGRGRGQTQNHWSIINSYSFLQTALFSDCLLATTQIIYFKVIILPPFHRS